MTKRSSMLLTAIAIAGLGAMPAARADPQNTARWQTIVGITDANNVVAGIQGGGQPWSALGGHALVDLRSGRMEFEVRGLVFAGGNTIGTPAPVGSVKGTIVCNATGANSQVIDTPLVPLDEEGNARFSGDLGSLPAICASQPDVAFLIRIPAGRWIANGAVLR